MGRKKIFKIFLVHLFLLVGNLFLSYPHDAVDSIYVSILDITKLALKNNLDIQIAKFDAYIERNSLLEAESIFDTFFNAQIDYTKNKLDTASVLLGTTSLTNDYSLGITKKNPFGTTLTLNAYNRRIWSNSSFYSLNPNTEANVEISLAQSLVKNFFGFSDRANIKITKINIANSDFSSLDSIEFSLSIVQKAYWEFVFRYKQWQIKKDMLKEAQNLYEIYKRKIKIGLVEKPDLLAAEANVLLRKNDVLNAEMLFKEAKNNLLYLLNITDVDKNILPLDSLDTTTENFNLYEQLKVAINKRRDYKIIKNQISASHLDMVLKRNALWPEVDLNVSFIKNGIDLNYKDAWREVSSESNYSWSVGVKVNFPLERRKEKADYNKAKLNEAKLLLLLKKTERIIFKEINDSITEVNILASRIKTLRNIVELQKRKLSAEETRLRYGRSSSDILIRYQNDVLNSRLLLTEMLFSYRIALVELARKKNTLLSQYWKGEL